MALYDLTHPLGPTSPVFPGDEPVRVRVVTDADAGAPYTTRRLELGTHSGTHVDAPAHVVPGGETVDRLPLDLWIGPALLLDVREVEQAPLGGVERLLLAGLVDGLTAAQAAAVTAAGVRLLGLDGPSADPLESEDLPVHRHLLGAGVAIVENLRLLGVPRGPGILYCLPLPVEGGDGAPCRALWQPTER